MNTVDVIIVGAGTAGLGALREVRKRTQSFIIVNDGPWGTICARDAALVGAELFAPEGEHLAHWLALAIHRRSTVFDLLRAPFYHPTVEEGLRTALIEIAKQLPQPSGDGTFPLLSAPGT
jgi:pyruvate/2-oxoglutarate dehydrogenase complex dihydrolipoamide dehydrogenase (E3) component